ncbi:MAG: SCO1664 family protein [Chloroflexota bacterium]|nr:MAG: SCO1664 family protein [Chloroflexota bacterium]
MTLSTDTILDILQHGTTTIKGEFLWGSNYTFLVDVEHNGSALQAVYKPTRGERPLWDFPAATLARREVAAYLLSEALDWCLVPPTVYTRKGPVGPGSLQYFIEHDPEYHYFNFKDADRQRLRPVAFFDIIINNADRKGSHILIGSDNHIWLIDHGICFHVEDKLRTVIWDFAGERIPENMCGDLHHLLPKLREPSGLVSDLKRYLSSDEINAVASRSERLLASNHFPNPHTSRRFQPWPPL